MKRLLLPLLTTIALPTAINANVDPEVRKACLAAADFEGCVRAYTQPVEKIKVEKFDFLGKPIIPNWEMYEVKADNKVQYVEKVVRKVKARGQYGRYITFDIVMRWYQDPVAGRPGSTTTIGSATTNCYGGSYSINCTTTPAPQLTIPGRSATPGGVRQVKYTAVIDCLDETWKSFGENKKWQPVQRNTYVGVYAEENCHKIDSLRPSNFQKFLKGKPNKKDQIAINTLSKRYKEYKVFGFRFTLNQFNQVQIMSVMKGFPADFAGIKENDLILEINNISTDGLNDISKVYRLLDTDKAILKIDRDGQIKMITVNKTTMKRFVLTKS